MAPGRDGIYSFWQDERRQAFAGNPASLPPLGSFRRWQSPAANHRVGRFPRSVGNIPYAPRGVPEARRKTKTWMLTRAAIVALVGARTLSSVATGASIPSSPAEQ